MREPQKVERLRPSLPLATPSIRRKPSELDQARFIGVKNQPELGEPFPHICQKSPRRLFLLKAHYTVVRITDNDDCSPLWLFTPVVNPLIEGVMQIDIRQQWRYHSSLRSALCRGCSASVLDHARFEPFADQAENPLIGDTPENQQAIGEAIAITVNLFVDDGSGTILKSDIIFNPSLQFSTTLASGTYDIQSIVTHELGHVLGASHSGVLSATMFWSTHLQNTDYSRPQPDDVAFASAVYRVESAKVERIANPR